MVRSSMPKTVKSTTTRLESCESATLLAETAEQSGATGIATLCFKNFPNSNARARVASDDKIVSYELIQAMQTNILTLSVLQLPYSFKTKHSDKHKKLSKL